MLRHCNLWILIGSMNLLLWAASASATVMYNVQPLSITGAGFTPNGINNSGSVIGTALFYAGSSRAMRRASRTCGSGMSCI
jgi:hypothetical protein